MKVYQIPSTTLAILLAFSVTSCRTAQHSLSPAKDAFGDLYGALVLIDCSSSQAKTYNPEAAATRLPPCSTFKIVNALVGLE